MVRGFGLGRWVGEGKVEGEVSRGWVGLDFGGGFQYNTGGNTQFDVLVGHTIILLNKFCAQKVSPIPLSKVYNSFRA